MLAIMVFVVLTLTAGFWLTTGYIIGRRQRISEMSKPLDRPYRRRPI